MANNRSASGGEPPTPTGAQTVEELTARLRALRAWAGWSYHSVHREVGRDRAARGVPERPAYNTVYRCFQPGRTRLDVALVVDIARVLLGDDSRPVAWRAACEVVAGAADAAGIVDVGGLPADLPGFVGRADELADVLAAVGTGDEPTIVSINGMPGVGKTRLAVHVAHVLVRAGRCAGPQLAVDLRGYDPDRPPADPAAVLDGFLRRLGLRGDQIQHLDLPARAAQYRRLLAGRPVVVLLDNAASVEQVRPLVPTVPGCVAVVTTRHRALELDGVHQLPIGAFTPAEAVALLLAAAGGRSDADIDAAGQIAELLGNLPLALAVTAARIRAAPDWRLNDHLDRLVHHRKVQRLEDSVELALALSYRDLTVDERRTFGLLALHAGADIEPYSAAALAGVDITTAEQHLEQLSSANLLLTPAAGRYAFHDLVRIYATVRVHDEQTARARRAALARLFAHYEHAAASATSIVVAPEFPVRLDQPPAATPNRRFLDQDAAVAWLKTEHRNLVAAAQYAAENGWPAHASHQSDILANYLDRAGQYRDAEILHRLALAAPDPAGQVHAFDNLGHVYLRLGRNDDALNLLRATLPRAREIGDPATERRVLNDLGVALMLVGRGTEAHACFQESLDIARVLKDRESECTAWDNLGGLLSGLGRCEEALDSHRHALEIARQLGDRVVEARVLGNIGYVYTLLERDREALVHYEELLSMASKAGDRGLFASALDSIGTTLARQGRYEEAEDLHQRSLEIAQEIGDRALVAVALMDLGIVFCALGRYQDALDLHHEALDVARDSALPLVECDILNAIGNALLSKGLAGESIQNHELALQIATKVGAAHPQARAHHGIGKGALSLGDQDAARVHLREALHRYTDIGIRVDGIKDELAHLDDDSRQAIQ